MATHSSVLAWRIPGTGGPGGLPSMGSHRVGHDWSDLAAAAAADTMGNIFEGGASKSEEEGVSERSWAPVLYRNWQNAVPATANSRAQAGQGAVNKVVERQGWLRPGDLTGLLLFWQGHLISYWTAQFPMWWAHFILCMSRRPSEGLVRREMWGDCWKGKSLAWHPICYSLVELVRGFIKYFFCSSAWVLRQRCDVWNICSDKKQLTHKLVLVFRC